MLAHQFDGYVTGGELTDRFAGREVKGNGLWEGGINPDGAGLFPGWKLPIPRALPQRWESEM